jgi:hypothetical protein
VKAGGVKPDGQLRRTRKKPRIEVARAADRKRLGTQADLTNVALRDGVCARFLSISKIKCRTCPFSDT